MIYKPKHILRKKPFLLEGKAIRYPSISLVPILNLIQQKLIFPHFQEPKLSSDWLTRLRLLVMQVLINKKHSQEKHHPT